jgi:hypothetical protein
MRENKLWENHRLILPEMREKATRSCGDCRFFIEIQGREEIRMGCVAGIPIYGALQKRVPGRLPVRDILALVGRSGLDGVLKYGDAGARACGLFKERI